MLILYSESRQTRLWIQNLPHPHIPQIGLSLLNLNPHCSLKYFTHRKTKRQKEKIQKYENTKRQYTEPPSPTNSTRLPSQSWIWINPSLKRSPPTTKELVTIFSFFSYANLLADKKYTASRNFFPKIRKCCWRSGISPKNWLSIDIWRSRNVLRKKRGKSKATIWHFRNCEKEKEGLVGGSYLKSGTGNGKAVIRVKCSFLQRFHSFWPPFFSN